MKKFDLVVLGGGPGGYIAAIRATQLGKSVAVIEKDKLGGVCLNRGCIPTKALLKAAHSVHELKTFKSLGINVELQSLDASVAVKRANQIASRVGKGVEFLMKKNNIEIINGEGILKTPTSIEVKTTEGVELVEAENIIVATGAHYKTFPGLEHDGDRLIGAYKALKMEEMPKSIGIIGAGAIGMEFAYFWNSFGVEVHIFELQDHLLPIEDTDCSIEIERAYKKLKIKQSLGIDKVSAKNNGDSVTITVENDGATSEHTFDKCLIAVGMTGNIDGIGLENVGVEIEQGFIQVDAFGKTTVPTVYAIGDVKGGALLAHAASHEGIIAAEAICGLKPHAIEPENIPACTFCQPQVASIGFTERALKEKGVEYSVGKVPFRANGKAVASNESDGFIKTIIGKEGQLLGAHIVGNGATELIHEFGLMKSQNIVDQQIFDTIHAHPTLGETISEAVMAAKGRTLNA